MTSIKLSGPAIVGALFIYPKANAKRGIFLKSKVLQFAVFPSPNVHVLVHDIMSKDGYIQDIKSGTTVLVLGQIVKVG